MSDEQSQMIEAAELDRVQAEMSGTVVAWDDEVCPNCTGNGTVFVQFGPNSVEFKCGVCKGTGIV